MSELKLRPPKKGRVEIEIGKEKSGSKDPPLHGTTQCKKLEKAKRGHDPDRVGTGVSCPT